MSRDTTSAHKKHKLIYNNNLPSRL
jgi:hypothetical protein